MTLPYRFKIVTNHWGWGLRGIRTWYSNWGKSWKTWGLERSWGVERRCKLGPITFSFGEFE